jgi:ABC-type phosphate transport system substrate-binding protein
MKRIAVLVVGILVLGAMVWAENALLINGAGATFPYPIYSKWFDEYHKKNPNIQFNYQSVGSGAGIKQMTEGTVDFGATDGPMNDDQLKAFQDKRGSAILHFPTVLGAAVPTYNVPGVAGALNFTPEALAGIFLGKITKWNDPAITGANKGVSLPANDIVVVHRSDGSGTTYIWTDYLSKVSDEWKSKVSKNTSVNWPVGQGQRRRDWTDQADAQFHRLRRVDLRSAEQHSLWRRQELLGEFCEGGPDGRKRGGSGCGEGNAGRFPGLHHQCTGKERLPDFELHLAADSAEVSGCG